MRRYDGFRLECRCIVNGKPLERNSICEQIAEAIRDRVYGDNIDIGYVKYLRLYDQDGSTIKDLELKSSEVIDFSEELIPYFLLKFTFIDDTTDEYTFYNALLYTTNKYSVAEASEANGYTKSANYPLVVIWEIKIYYSPW